MSKRTIAVDRITNLFKQAEIQFPIDPELSNRYVHLAQKIAQKARISIFKPYKYQFCKNCLHFQFPGKNQRKRTYKGKIILTCLNCKYIRRISI